MTEYIGLTIAKEKESKSFYPFTRLCCQMATSLFFIVQIYTIIVAGVAIHSSSMEEN